MLYDICCSSLSDAEIASNSKKLGTGVLPTIDMKKNKKENKKKTEKGKKIKPFVFYPQVTLPTRKEARVNTRAQKPRTYADAEDSTIRKSHDYSNPLTYMGTIAPYIEEPYLDEPEQNEDNMRVKRVHVLRPYGNDYDDSNWTNHGSSYEASPVVVVGHYFNTYNQICKKLSTSLQT